MPNFINLYEPLDLMMVDILDFLRGEKPLYCFNAGTGTNGVVDLLENARCLDYSKIKGLPQYPYQVPTAKLWFGHIAGKPVIINQKRLQRYEGFHDWETMLLTLAAIEAGAKCILSSSVVGLVNPDCNSIGELGLVTGHLNFANIRPFAGILSKNGKIDHSMHAHMAPYNEELIYHTLACAYNLRIPLNLGCYGVLTTGFEFETAEEADFLRKQGVHYAGMSLISEATAAAWKHIPFLGIALPSNPGANITTIPLRDDDIRRTSLTMFDNICLLLREFIKTFEINSL